MVVVVDNGQAEDTFAFVCVLSVVSLFGFFSKEEGPEVVVLGRVLWF